MKKVFKFCGFGILILISIFSCTDLNTKEVDSVVIKQTGNGSFSGNPKDLLESAYKDLGNITAQDNIYALYNHTADELIPPTRGTDWGDNGVWTSLYNHTWTATHSQVLTAWNQANSNAYKCNQILASSPNVKQAAEAKFLRAFWMWHVMDLYGQVPFRNVTDGPNVSPTVKTRSEAFDFIVNDLTESLTGLDPGVLSSTNPTASKAAANAMLARLYLNKGVYKATNPEGSYTFDAADMTKVIQYADAVTADGFSLESDYFTNFTTSASKEIILTSKEGTPQNRWKMTLHYQSTPDGWNGFATLADFYAKFEVSDQRRGKAATPNGTLYSGLAKGFLVGQQLKDDGTKAFNLREQVDLSFTPEVPLVGARTDAGIRVIKYHPADAGQYILLRYSDVYLMKAEAMFRSNNVAGALTMVNNLRTTRGASALSNLTESDLLDERGRELYWEGIRRVDLVRFGKFADAKSQASASDPKRALFPIPQQAIDSNPNLKQNPAYSGN